MAKYPPVNFKDLKAWLNNFIEKLEPHLVELQMTESDLDELRGLSTGFGSAVDDYIEKQSLLWAASGRREELRTAVTRSARAVMERVSHHPAMSEGLRRDLGMRPRLRDQPTEPIAGLKPGIRLVAGPGCVRVHWGKVPTDERRNGKPRGVKAGVIYRKRSGESDFRIIGYATRSPYRDWIEGPGADYTYVVRYHGTRQNELSEESVEHTVAARGVKVA